jgi:hypothetical protein
MNPSPAGAKAGDAAPDVATAPVVDSNANGGDVDNAKLEGTNALDQAAMVKT